MYSLRVQLSITCIARTDQSRGIPLHIDGLQSAKSTAALHLAATTPHPAVVAWKNVLAKNRCIQAFANKFKIEATCRSKPETKFHMSWTATSSNQRTRLKGFRVWNLNLRACYTGGSSASPRAEPNFPTTAVLLTYHLHLYLHPYCSNLQMYILRCTGRSGCLYCLHAYLSRI